MKRESEREREIVGQRVGREGIEKAKSGEKGTRMKTVGTKKKRWREDRHRLNDACGVMASMRQRWGQCMRSHLSYPTSPSTISLGLWAHLGP